MKSSRLLADSYTFDYCIIGAGLAGLSIAGELSGQGAKNIVFDKNDIASGASGTPVGLVNPATGRFGTKSWETEKCYRAIAEDLEKIQSSSPISIYKKSGILRPAIDANIAHKMRENFTKTEWPEDWCSWLDENEIRQMNADIHCVDGGLWLPIGLTVDIPSYLKAKADLLKAKGVEFRMHSDFSIKNEEQAFKITDSKGNSIQAASLIYCAGIATKNSEFWDFLPLIPVKGQVAILKKTDALNLDFAISALGYIGSMVPGTFVIGSTYEHHFDHQKPDENGLNYMKSRLSKVYPKLFESSELIGQWAGVRASTPDRMPIIGRHPKFENVFVFAGLGSKGLLYSSFLGRKFCDFLLNSSALPKEVFIERFLK